jgi:hypothetical protein
LAADCAGHAGAVWSVSQTMRCILQRRLARPILVFARARNFSLA